MTYVRYIHVTSMHRARKSRMPQSAVHFDHAFQSSFEESDSVVRSVTESGERRLQPRPHVSPPARFATRFRQVSASGVALPLLEVGGFYTWRKCIELASDQCRLAFYRSRRTSLKLRAFRSYNRGNAISGPI